jgi:hypothetical protein
MSNYDNIPISEETKKGMSLTIDDQAFIKRCFDRQDETIEAFIKSTYDEHATIIIGVVREMIEEQNEKLLSKIDEQNKIIKEIQQLISDIQDELREHDARIKKLESKVQKLFLEHKNNHND